MGLLPGHGLEPVGSHHEAGSGRMNPSYVGSSVKVKATTGGRKLVQRPPLVALKDIGFLKSGYWIFGVKMGDINYLKLGYWDIGPPTTGP